MTWRWNGGRVLFSPNVTFPNPLVLLFWRKRDRLRHLSLPHVPIRWLYVGCPRCAVYAGRPHGSCLSGFFLLWALYHKGALFSWILCGPYLYPLVALVNIYVRKLFHGRTLDLYQNGLHADTRGRIITHRLRIFDFTELDCCILVRHDIVGGQSWVSTIQSVVLAADVFLFFVKYCRRAIKWNDSKNVKAKEKIRHPCTITFLRHV